MAWVACLSAVSCSESDDEALFRANIQRTGEHFASGVPELNEVIWTFKTSGWIRSSASVYDGVVYFGSDDANLYAVDIVTGQKKWAFDAENDVVSSPAVKEGVVYFGSWDNFFYAVDLYSGQQQWTFKAEASIVTTPAIHDGVVFFGSFDNFLYALK